MKEMVGGCCVCSDERGWDENPLVYCDGPSCNVAVHQACYGIVAVPSGNWYCRKCESSDRATRVRCELCPLRDGAFKKTDTGKWAHVVCALYIPEVSFENVTTMEPIEISLIPPERYSKICYICEERADKKDSKSATGACMQCNKTGCKQHFHVTCAQMLGLLCEEAGNMMDNVKYCGYCEYHYGKLKKTSNLKTIPPFKPIPSGGNGVDSPNSSPEKQNPKHSSSIGGGGGNPSESSSNLPSSFEAVPPKTKGSSKKAPGGSKASSVSSGGSSNGSAANNNNSASIPRVLILPSKLFSGFSNGNNQNPGSKQSKSPSPSLGDEVQQQVQSEKNSPKSIRKEEEKSDTSSHFMSSKSKDLATVSMKEVLSTALDKPMVSTGSKFDRAGSSSTLTGGIAESTSTFSSPTGNGPRIDKPPPDIVPHVTLTPIPMKSNEDSKRSKSPPPPSGFPASFGHSNKKSMDEEMATLEKTVASPSKRMRLPLMPPRREDYDSDTESAEEWDTESRSQSNSTSAIPQKDHLSRRDQQHPMRMLTEAQASEMAHWESSKKSPTVSLKRIPTAKARVNSYQFQQVDTNPRKRGPGRPSAASRGFSVGSSRDDDSRSSKGGKRGRRGSSGNYGGRARESPNQNHPSGSIQLDDNAGDGVKIEDTSEQMNGGSGRGGRHGGPMRKTTAPPPPPPSTNPRKPNYDDGPTLTMSQLKAQMNSSSNSDKTTHMFGNALNPASSMAQRMVDTLSQEMESVGNSACPIEPNAPTQVPTPVVGIPFPGKSSIPKVSTSNGNPVNNNGSKPHPQTLEELLERQWEQGSQFFMEQAQHLDISQLLSCLNQLKADNKALEDHVASLCQRKEQLTAINARLSIPLTGSNTLALGLGLGNSRQETPPLNSKNPAIMPSSSQPPPPPQQQPPPPQHTQIHHNQQQEGRHYHSSYKYHGYEQQGHVYHRGGSSQMMYGYNNNGSQNSSHSQQQQHQQQPRDNR